jgi:Fe-S cluster assembly protein SufD
MNLATTTTDLLHHYHATLLEHHSMMTHPLHGLSDQLNKDFDVSKWPTTRHEEWKYTSLKALSQIEFSLDASSDSKKLKSYLESLPFYHTEAHHLVFVNGLFHSELSRLIPGEEKTVSSTYVHASLIPEQLAKVIGISSPAERDELRKLNNMVLHDGLSIQLSKGKTATQVYVYQLIDSEQPFAVHSRNLIHLAENTECKVVEHFAAFGNKSHWFNPTTEIQIDAHARLEYCLLQTQANVGFFTGLSYLRQSDSSQLSHHTVSTGGRLVRNNLDLILDGSHIESHMNGLYMLTDDTLVDNHTLVDHQQPHSNSNEFYKGIMDGKSCGVFNGKIFVRQAAQKTNAFQSNRNIVLSPDASVYTKPQLEIFADDVKCSHGATSGQLDEESIFYLRSRGLSHAQAKALLTKAFAGEVVERIPQPELRAYIEQQIDKRF